MTLSEFRCLALEAFGAQGADYLLLSHVLIDVDGKTPYEAIDDGYSVKRVWLALCNEFELDDYWR